MRIYIAGPMTGYPEFNYPAFFDAAAKLRAAGFEVYNPAGCAVPSCGSWEGYMRICIPNLMTCQAVALLPGWRRSRGASLEVHNAEALEMSCRPIEAWLAQQEAA